MIRVLQLLTHTALGGVPRHVLHLVRHLPDEFRITVAGPSDPIFPDDLPEGVRFAEVAIDSLRAFPMTLQSVARLVRKTGADVVHTHGKGAGVYGRLAAWLAGVPSVHTLHGIHYESFSRASRSVYLGLERKLALITQTVINLSEAQDAEALRLGMARPGHSVVVVNGIDVGELDARPASNRKDFGLEADDEVLGCVARFDPVKRHDVVVNAVARVAERHPKVRLLLIGDGPERARIVKLAEDTGVHYRSPGVVGWQRNFYTSFDLCVTASAKEGLPLVLLEAMATERAVVATDVPGHRDVVVDGETGLLVPAGDDARLAAAIESLLEDRARRTRMGKAGRERVQKKFTLESMVAKTAEVYRAAAAAGKATRRA